MKKYKLEIEWFEEVLFARTLEKTVVYTFLMLPTGEWCIYTSILMCLYTIAKAVHKDICCFC